MSDAVVPDAVAPDGSGTPVGDAITIANEFAEVRVRRVETRNGARLLVESPKSGQWITLCPLELESLTWQSPATFSAMIGNPFAPLVPPDEVQQR